MLLQDEGIGVLTWGTQGLGSSITRGNNSSPVVCWWALARGCPRCVPVFVSMWDDGQRCFSCIVCVAEDMADCSQKPFYSLNK